MKRSEIEEKFKWNISEIFSSDDEFYKELDKLKPQIKFSNFKGKLSNKQEFKKCFDKLYDVSSKFEVLAVYAMMRKDEDGSNSKAVALDGIIDSVSVKFSTETAFINTELCSYSEEYIESLLNDKDLQLYKNDIMQIKKLKSHVLSLECENMLALSGKVLGGYHQAFSMIDNVDLDLPTIKVNGKNVKVTGANYSLLLQNEDENVRKKAFKSYYKAYEKVLNTITAIYTGNVEKDVFLARVRKFDSALDRALFGEEVDKVVYEKLINCVHNNLSVLHDYIAERKNIKGDNLYMYDLYYPLVKGSDLKLDFYDAFNLVKEGLKPLGEDYLKLLQKAVDERWIDVYENEGKRGGAYSVCVYNLKHPYVLLNHTKTTHSVFTIAHELGHAMHSYKSNATQPVTTADYKIFVAEVASTVNEILLIKYLIKTAKTSQDKKYYLSYYLDTLRTTLFRQTMFAEFEQKVHNIAENDMPITKDELNKIYLKLNKEYYGKSVIHNKEISYEWARIPHFYTAFYVYKYATGIISAVNIAENILNNGEKAVEKYFEFLSSGSVTDPVSLLKIASVDLTTDEPYNVCMNSFANALLEFKKL